MGLRGQMFAFYTIAGSRGAEVLVAMLGIVFGGILCNDRAPAFLKYHSGLMQFCWAHLKRTLLGIADSARSPLACLFLPGCIGDFDSAVPTVAPVSRRSARSPRKPEADRPVRADGKIAPIGEEAVCSGRGSRQSRRSGCKQLRQSTISSLRASLIENLSAHGIHIDRNVDHPRRCRVHGCSHL